MVELMIVVAVVGVLAALAVYGVRVYISTTKTAEAKNILGAINRGAASAYEREFSPSENLNEGTPATLPGHRLCGTAVTVPTEVPKAAKYQPITAEGSDFETGDTLSGWKCLRYRLKQPHYYQYHYVKDGTSAGSTNTTKCSSDCYETAAVGDLDGDSVTSLFALTGQINVTTGQLRTQPAIYVAKQFE